MDNLKYILIFSAKSKQALENTSNQIIDFLKENQDVSLADASWTLQSGRRAYNYRKTVVLSRADLQNGLTQGNAANVVSVEASKNVVFAFPGTNDLLTWWQLTEKIHDDRVQKLFYESKSVILDRLPSALSQKIRSTKSYDSRVSCYQAYISGYVCNQVLTKLGIVPTAYVGAEVSELTAMTCSGALAIDHALEIIEQHGELETYQTVYQSYEIKPRQVPIMLSPSQKARQHIQQGVMIKLGTPQLSNWVLEGCLDQPSEVFHLFEESSENMAENLYQLISHLWCKGFNIAWDKLNIGQKVRKVILPTYVFDKIAFNSDISSGAAHFLNEPSVGNAVGNLFRKTDPLETLRGLWAEIVGKQEIHDNDDFFQIGGDSLNGIMLSSRIREQLNVNLSLTDIFANSTFKKMSMLVGNSIIEIHHDEIPVLPRSEFYEASSAQKRMFVINECVEEGVPYNFADVYQLNGRIDQGKLSDAFQILVNRHDAFRTQFDMVKGEIVQRIKDTVDFNVTFITSNHADLKSNIERSIRPFNLYQAPLLRVVVISLNEQEHVVVIDMHHIISDQTSLSILVEELSCIYQNKSLPKLEIQYKDFAHWQNDHFKNGNLDSQLKYWKNEFKDGIPSLTLQTDYNRPELMQYHGDKVTYKFDAELSRRIHAASTTYDVTPYMVMLTTLNILLWKYTGQTDIPIGTAVAGRKHFKLASVVGMFVNTLVIKTQISGQSTIGEFIQYIKEKMLMAYDNQDFQFDMLVEVLNPPKNLSRNPLFDVLLNYVKVGSEQVEIGGNIWSAYEKDEIGIKQDLGFIVEENDNGFMLDVEYSKALYRRETIELMGERFMLILSEMLENGNCTLNEISIISKAERNWLLNIVNQTQTDAPLNKTIINLFEEGVEAQPEAVAIEWQDQKITYWQFNNLVNQMAEQLALQQVSYKDIVPILLEWGPMQIVSMFSIMKLGAAYLPIDPTYPKERIDFILQDSASKIVITDNLEQDKIGFSIQKFIINSKENTLDISLDSGLCSVHTPTELDSEDICYVIYTSGSTGLPKGTRIKHKNVIRTVRNTNYANIEFFDRVIQISNYVFDASVMNIFLALLNRACLVVIPRSLSIEIARLAQFIKERNITVFALPTALFHLIIDWDADSLKNVRRIIVGGEQMSLEHTKKALAIMGSGKLVDGYGPTESTVIATYYIINDLSDTDVIPIGYPVSNTSIYVVDDEKNLSPIGVPGELHIGGEGVGAGYLNRPELTRERFAPLPTANGQVTYATGDIVMWNSRRELIFLGRKDFQFKINGYRVELEEVERYIETINGVKKAVVTALKDLGGNLYLKTFYTLEDYHQRHFFDGEYIRISLRNKVPEYMVPCEYMVLPEFPLNHSGKIDKKALLDMKVRSDDSPAAGDHEVNLDSIILNAMKHVLNNQEISLDDNFFNVGGQSIRAIALAKGLLEQGIQIKVNDIFQYQTAKQLASYLKNNTFKAVPKTKKENSYEKDYESLNEAQIDSLVSMALAKQSNISDFIVSTGNIAKFSLSPIQVCHHKRGSGFSGVLIEVAGEYLEYQICDAITKAIMDNQLLRSVLVTADDTLQWSEHSGDGFHAISRISYGYIDLSCYLADTNAQIVSKLSHDIFTVKYEEGVLRWNLCIVKRQADNHLIIWGLDHLIFDGMSAEILKRQVSDNLNHTLQEKLRPVRPYSDYVKLLQSQPLDLKPQDIIDKFDLLNWSKLNNQIVLKQQRSLNWVSTDAITIEVPLNDVEVSNIWQFAVNLVTGVLKEYFEIPVVPLALVDYGREYGSESFYNTVGEFLDVIPVMSDAVEASSDESIFQYCKKSSLNFLSLLGLENPVDDYLEVRSLIKKDFYPVHTYFNFILLNFQGYISRDDESTLAQISDDSNLARTVVTIHYDKVKLYLEIEDVYGLDKEKIMGMAKELIEKLRRESKE